MVHRRQILLATLVAGSAGTAGCVSDDPSDDNGTDDDPSAESAENGDEDVPSDLESTADGVYRVDVDAVSDRSVSFDDDQTLTYAGGSEVVWWYERVLEFDPSTESDESTPELTVDPVIDTTDDAAHLFLAPVYDADGEQWEIHAYADEAYYEGRETHQFWIGRFYAESDEEQSVRGRDAEFTEHHDGVYRATLEYGETPESEDFDRSKQVFLTNREWDESALEEAESIRGAATSIARVGPPSPDYDEVDEDDPAPMVEFSFAYDPDAKTVTIVHEGGPSFQGDNVQVEFEAGVSEDQFSSEVGVGDSLEVEVPSADPGEYLGIAWRGPEDEHYIILDRFQIPE
ncbi:hypothetical protein [Natronorubrum halophilum]|uniref:hypothetical protein n=1 Tax=Natronorubrum halophilum TaxID=1702106 RepID=UPI000EF6FB21|nr:hypothetical protein [Natronorubrum halophilum]